MTDSALRVDGLMPFILLKRLWRPQLR
ncbi:MAG: hypothetical protein RLZZ245_2317, partial [Verrucomicrobiota bacterium]